jgi:hypothetical protein
MKIHKLTYSEFNLKCCEYYCSNNSKDKYGSFLIPPSEIVDWLGLQYDNPKIEFTEIKNHDWSHFLKVDPFTKIPRCFGIIALQCYGAFLRQNTEKTTDRQLNRAIENLLCYTSQQLQAQFGSGYPNTQDKIWISAQKYLLKKGFEILLPEPSFGPGRNVQYPKSQVFFNLEMFKSLHPVLKLAEEQFISDFGDFRTLITAKLRDNSTTIRRINNLLDNTENRVRNRSVFIVQLYNYWRSSDWKNAYLLILKEKNYTKRSRKNGNEVDFQVFYDIDENLIQFYSIEEGMPIELNDSNISQVIESGPILFTNSKETPFDFFQVFNFSRETPYLIFCKIHSSVKEKLDTLLTIRWVTNDKISFAYFPKGINDPRIPALFSDFSETISFNPVQLFAPKIDFRKDIILHGHKIELKIDLNYMQPNQVKLYTMIGNRKSNEIQLPKFNGNSVILEDLIPSKYRIPFLKFNSIEFEVAEVSYTNNINSINHSFHISDFSFKEDLEGINGIYYPLKNTGVLLSYKNVASVLLYKTKIKSDNLLLKALNRANHGRN